MVSSKINIYTLYDYGLYAIVFIIILSLVISVINKPY